MGSWNWFLCGSHVHENYGNDLHQTAHRIVKIPLNSIFAPHHLPLAFHNDDGHLQRQWWRSSTTICECPGPHNALIPMFHFVFNFDLWQPWWSAMAMATRSPSSTSSSRPLCAIVFHLMGSKSFSSATIAHLPHFGSSSKNESPTASYGSMLHDFCCLDLCFWLFVMSYLPSPLTCPNLVQYFCRRWLWCHSGWW